MTEGNGAGSGHSVVVKVDRFRELFTIEGEFHDAVVLCFGHSDAKTIDPGFAYGNGEFKDVTGFRSGPPKVLVSAPESGPEGVKTLGAGGSGGLHDFESLAFEEESVVFRRGLRLFGGSGVGLDEGKDAFFISYDDIDLAIAVKIASGDLSAHSGIVIDEIGDEFSAAVLVPGRPEPIKDGGIVRAGVAAVVGEVALTGDDILNAVAIDIDTVHSMGLGETNAVGISYGLIRHHDMLFKGDGSVFLDLFIPSHSPGVGIEGGNDVVIAIAIDIVGEHLGSSLLWGEGKRMKFPGRLAVPVFRLLPPAAFFENIGKLVAINVAGTEAMNEHLNPAILRGDAMNDPGFGRVGSWLRESDVAPTMSEQLPALAQDINILGRFIADVLLGGAVFALVFLVVGRERFFAGVDGEMRGLGG